MQDCAQAGLQNNPQGAVHHCELLYTLLYHLFTYLPIPGARAGVPHSSKAAVHHRAETGVCQRAQGGVQDCAQTGLQVCAQRDMHSRPQTAVH